MTDDWPYAFKLGVVLEEIHPDPEVSLPFARDLGMTHVEFGSLWGRPLDQTSEADRERMRELLHQHGLQVAMVGPSTFKMVYLGHLRLDELASDPPFRRELESMRRVLEAARYFGSPLARTFSFRREGMVGLGNPSPRLPAGGEIEPGMLEKLGHALRLICEVADEAGVDLGLENVRSCWANTGHNTRRIVEAVGSPHLKVVWDPANAFVSGEEAAFPEGYDQVKPYVAHVHLKDARLLDPATGLTAWERIGDGEVDYKGQLAALMADGYRGVVSVETHYQPAGKSPAEATRLTTQGLRAVLASLS
ncbi:MAG: sugar phosphate isomerase/epimerase [Anaerolineae bacterium]|nr:sugar phosphate isomerase/epimerase [Anaerolineae bacterium]